MEDLKIIFFLFLSSTALPFSSSFSTSPLPLPFSVVRTEPKALVLTEHVTTELNPRSSLERLLFWMMRTRFF